MAETTGIAWTSATWNPVVGCQAVSCACDFCYAQALVRRWGGDFAARRRTAPSNWRKPLQWNKAAHKAGVRRTVFCASLADVFDNKWEPEWRADMWEVIRACPMLDFQLLTKRPQNIAGMLPPDWGQGWPNVWLGTTVENQVEADRRIPYLARIPAVVRFLSAEPLLSRVETPFLTSHFDPFGNWRAGGAIHWVIIGGESGPGARPMRLAWALELLRRCDDAGVPAFFKQVGSAHAEDDWWEGITGKGDDPAQWPPAWRIQDFPLMETPP